MAQIMHLGVPIGGTVVENILTSTSTTNALSANMGRELKALIDGKEGGGSIIRVTFDVEQAGDTITFTLAGMETKTETVPVAEPYIIEISTTEMGTMTIYDETADITNTLLIDTYKLYEYTFKNRFDYLEWLTLGNVSGTYASLEEVLADEKALRQLFTKHASVDYLVECCADSLDDDVLTIVSTDLCAKWINLRDYALDKLYENQYIKVAMDTFDKYFYGELVEVDGEYVPKGNVPIMTSDSAPYGNAIGNYTHTYNPWRVFDGKEETETASYAELFASTTINGGYCGYKFVNPISVRRVVLVNRYMGFDMNQGVKTCKVRYSDDGVTYTDATEVLNCQGNVATRIENVLEVPDVGYHLYWQVYILTNYGATEYVSIKTLQFYGRELKVSVPKMDGNTSPWGEAIGDSSIIHIQNPQNWEYYKPFNQSTIADASSIVQSTLLQSNNYWGYDFKNPVIVKFMEFGTYWYNSEVNLSLKNFKVQGFASDGAWEDIGEYYNQVVGANLRYFITLDNDKVYNKYRIIPLDTWNNINFVIIRNAQFYGLDYSEHEERRWIYDHGVEVETLEDTGFSDSGFVFTKPTRNSDNIQFITDGGTSEQAIGVIKDLTPYVLNRVVMNGYGVNVYSTNCFANQIVNKTKAFGASSLANALIVYDNIPYNIYCDITNVNEEAYVCLQAWSGKKFSFNEWWLE